MELLSGEPLYAAVSKIPTDQVINLCATNEQLNANLCDNEDFWQYRYIQDRGQPTVIPASWKRAYLAPTNIYLPDLNGQEQIRSLTFPKEVADVKLISTKVLEYIVVLTTDGEVYRLLLMPSFQQTAIQVSEPIKQTAITHRERILLLAESGQLYIVDSEAIARPLSVPFSIKLMTDTGALFLSDDHQIYRSQGVFQYNDPRKRGRRPAPVVFYPLLNQPLTDDLAHDISQLSSDRYRSNHVQFLAHGRRYSANENSIKSLEGPGPIRKLIPPGLALLDNGQIWSLTYNQLYDPTAPLAHDASPGMIIIDESGIAWRKKDGSNLPRRKNDSLAWTNLNLPTKVSRVDHRVLWGPAPLVTSFAHFSQLVNRGKIPEFKVPAQPGMNEPYVDTFLIPDVEGYQYEVTARYDPQTGQMTAL